MKTIIAAFVQRTYTAEELRSVERYAFNTEEEVKEGELLLPPHNANFLQIIKVMDKEYKFVNTVTGDLKDSMSATKDVPIKTLVVRTPSSGDVVYVTRKL